MNPTAERSHEPTPSRRRFTVDEFHRMAEAGIFGEDDRLELSLDELYEGL